MFEEDFLKQSWQRIVENKQDLPVYDIFYLESLIKNLKLEEKDRKILNYFLEDLKNKSIEYFELLSKISEQRELTVEERTTYDFYRRTKHQVIIDDINKIIEIISHYDKNSANILGSLFKTRDKVGIWAFETGKKLKELKDNLLKSQNY